MAYWWVNHKQTFKEEINGGFIWAPFFERNGSRSQFYDNLKRVKPGELIYSYAYKKISYVGVIQSRAIPFPKPAVFKGTENPWSEQGRMVPVDWMEVPRPLTVSEAIPILGKLFPQKYSPFNPIQNRGNQKAYLAEISKELFDKVASLTQSSMFYFQQPNEDASDLKELQSKFIDFSMEDNNLDQTEDNKKSKARKGQAKFKANLKKVESMCRITKVRNPELLIASHIKPWRCCETATERLDGNNGFLFTPDADKLFDKGFFTIDEDRQIKISNDAPITDLEKLGLGSLQNIDVGTLNEAQWNYLKFHREVVFIET